MNLSSSNRPAVLCVVAHPDDETILCGGTLALLAARGVAVHLVCLTRGEGGELGEPPVTTREQLGEARERELVAAAGALKAASLTLMDYVDPEVGPEGALYAPAHDPVMLTGQILGCIEQFKPQVLLTHGSNGEYGHPAHLLVHRMTRAALGTLVEEQAPLIPAWYTFAAIYAEHPYPRLSNADDPADLVIDVTGALDQKEAAARCHASQQALFVRRRSQAAGRALALREVLLPQESFRRQWPKSLPIDDPFFGTLANAQPRPIVHHGPPLSGAPTESA